MGRGIDYGMGQTNVDTATGIRFGIIGQHDLAGWAMGEAEPVYGEPTCPKCGETVKRSENVPHAKKDYVCTSCHKLYWSDAVYGDEPKGWTLADEPELKVSGGTDGDVWVFKSPYFTRAGFCSPCAPGAGDLRAPCDDGEKTYCLGHEWFDEKRAPYPVYRVDTGELVNPEE